MRLRAGLEAQPFFVRLTRDLVRLLQERTERRLRLPHRPAAAARSRLHPAGDVDRRGAQLLRERRPELGARGVHQGARRSPATCRGGAGFLAELAPFIWRKYLDFAAIADIHAIKRQIHAFSGFGEIAVAGHDIKVGRGGIREIEFFVQTQQLICRRPPAGAARCRTLRRAGAPRDARLDQRRGRARTRPRPIASCGRSSIGCR